MAATVGLVPLTIRKVWLVSVTLLLGYPLKETIGIVVPVVWVWCWAEYRSGRRSLAAAAAPAVASTIAFVVSVGVWRNLLPSPAASWEVTPDLGDLFTNLFDLISLGSFAVGVLPLLLPSFLLYRQRSRVDGWLLPLFDPATVGVLAALGICAWAFITVDLARLFWIGFPFAVSLTALWFDTDRPKEWLDRVKLPHWLVP